MSRAEPEDLLLVEGLRARDERAVEEFLARYKSLVHHCIGQFTHDATEREDLYQDLVIHVLDRLDRDAFDPEKGGFGTWLYRVSWCRCVDLRRRAGARRRPKLTPVGEDLPDQPDESPSPVELAGEQELTGVVRSALGDLEPEERMLLELRFVEGKTLQEVGEELGISLEQTKYRLRRATVALRKRLLLLHVAEEALA